MKATLNLENDYGFVLDMDISDKENPSVTVYDFEGNEISGGGGGSYIAPYLTLSLNNNSGENMVLSDLFDIDFLIPAGVMNNYFLEPEGLLGTIEPGTHTIYMFYHNAGDILCGLFNAMADYSTSNPVNCSVLENEGVYAIVITDETANASIDITFEGMK